jgi:hypothetical protein
MVKKAVAAVVFFVCVASVLHALKDCAMGVHMRSFNGATFCGCLCRTILAQTDAMPVLWLRWSKEPRT